MSLTAGINSALANTKDAETGIGGYRLFARVNDTTKYSNVVPVDVLEDGSNSSDDILNNPITVTITGVVGDLIIESSARSELIGRDFSSVGEITALLPAKSQQQIQRISQIDSELRNVALLAERAKRLAGNAYAFFNNSGSAAKSQQEKFIEYMEAIHYSRLPINLSTKYRDYDNMALNDLTITSDNEINQVNFTASFTQITLLQLVYVEIEQNYSSPAGTVSGKTSDIADKGGQNPEEDTETSLLSSIFG